MSAYLKKDYEKILYDTIIKPLIFDENGDKLSDAISAYLNDASIDENSQPSDYVIYRVNISNLPEIFGDGSTKLRRSNCDILVVEAGNGNKPSAGYLANKIENKLIENNITYSIFNLGYNNSTDNVQVIFDFYLI